jgi:hypothetical protein
MILLPDEAAGPPAPDQALLARSWDALVEPGDVHEVRLPKTRRGPARLWGVASGYFDDRDAFVAALAPLSGADAEGAYLTLNPVAPALLARAANRLVCGRPPTSADADVIRLRRLLLDLDPVRPAGISATATERDAAVARREAVRDWLRAGLGWPHPEALLESGNGAGLVYRLDDLPNDPGHAAMLRAVLAALDRLFSDGAVTVDACTHNPSRLLKVPGTVAAKGDHVPRLGRPWRRASARFNPDPRPVSTEQLHALIAAAPGAQETVSPSARGSGPGARVGHPGGAPRARDRLPGKAEAVGGGARAGPMPDQFRARRRRRGLRVPLGGAGLPVPPRQLRRQGLGRRPPPPRAPGERVPATNGGGPRRDPAPSGLTLARVRGGERGGR